MIESVESVVVLDDLDASVMAIILDFVYGRILEVPEEHAVALFKASDRLQLPELNKMAVGLLKDQVKSETITDVLQIAGNFMNEELWMACVEYIKANMVNFRGRSPST